MKPQYRTIVLDGMEKRPLTRRDFLASSLAFVAGVATVPVPARSAKESSAEARNISLGLALGSGGASGLAHIPMLEVLDDLEITPKMIAGCSIGAIIGAMYASGLSGKALREIATGLFSADMHVLQTLFPGRGGLSLLDLIQPDIGRGGLLESQGFMDFLQDHIRVSQFEELKIPLKIVAADYWKRELAVFETGPIIPAVKASMAVPGLFAPVAMDDRLLVDGSTLNPLPFDLLEEECGLVLAIDVSGGETVPGNGMPDILDVVFNSFEMLQQAITREKIRRRPPELYVRPDVQGIRLMHFHKAERIFEQTAPSAEELRASLLSHLYGII